MSPATRTHTTLLTPDFVHGAVEVERTPRGLRPHRLPGWVRSRGADERILAAEIVPAGVRVVFRTEATSVRLDAIPTKTVYAGVPPRPEGMYDLVVDGVVVDGGTVAGGDTVTVDMATGGTSHRTGPAGSVEFSGLDSAPKTVAIWLPHNEATLLVSVTTDAPIAPVHSGFRRTWLHHGSSISQGSNASRPTATWLASAALLGDVDPINLGFSGSALVDPFVARTMRDVPADLISVALGINVVNADSMRMRAFTSAVHGFLDTVRDGHPTAPLVVVTPLFTPIHEHTPGPGAFDADALRSGVVRFVATGDPADVPQGRPTLGVVREELERIVAERRVDDPNISVVHGLSLFGAADHDAAPLPDALHPSEDAHLTIGERFARKAFGPHGPFHDPNSPVHRRFS